MSRLAVALVVVAAALASPAQAHARLSQSWVKEGVVLAPTEAWEQTKVYEPTVVHVGGEYRLYYTGGYYPTATGLATSRDGRHWRKRGIVVGLGHGGFTGPSSRNSVVVHGGITYLYFCDDHDVYVATSHDGYSFTTQAEPVLRAGAPWNDMLANTAVVHVRHSWRMLFEARTLTGKPYWQTGLAVSRSLRGPFRPVRRALTGLGVTSSGMYGGPWVERHGRDFVAYYHASHGPAQFPTAIYKATSHNLTSWHGRRFVLGRSLDFEFDQVADPSLVTFHGEQAMYYDGDNNPAHTAEIGLTVRRRT